MGHGQTCTLAEISFGFVNLECCRFALLSVPQISNIRGATTGQGEHRWDQEPCVVPFPSMGRWVGKWVGRQVSGVGGWVDAIGWWWDMWVWVCRDGWVPVLGLNHTHSARPSIEHTPRDHPLSTRTVCRLSSCPGRPARSEGALHTESETRQSDSWSQVGCLVGAVVVQWRSLWNHETNAPLWWTHCNVLFNLDRVMMVFMWWWLLASSVSRGLIQKSKRD